MIDIIKVKDEISKKYLGKYEICGVGADLENNSICIFISYGIELDKEILSDLVLASNPFRFRIIPLESTSDIADLI